VAAYLPTRPHTLCTGWYIHAALEVDEVEEVEEVEEADEVV
jgi:hypothetical protein